MSSTPTQVKPTVTRHSDLSFDDMYYEISHDWRRKAQALQIRRWRILKHETKPD